MPYKDTEQQRAYQRQWIANRRTEYLSDKRCKRCGSTEKLNMHHRDPAKKVTHKIWSLTDKKRKAEIEKCDVLCEPCHQELHKGKAQHGGYTMYRHHKCRCDKCRAGYSRHMKAYRARKKAELN